MQPQQQLVDFDSQGNMLVPSVQSPNYNPGIAGWAIKKDGSAEFNNVVIRGATTQNGVALYYSGTPALGNLVVSIAASAGVDSFGNAYQAGLTVYTTDTLINIFGDDIVLNGANGSKAVLESGSNASLFLTPDPTTGPWFAGGMNSNIGGGNHPTTEIFSPTDSVNGNICSISLEGSSTADARTIILSACTFWNHTGTFQINSSDIGSGIQSMIAITANVTGITTTEQVIATVPSMKFVNGRSYKVVIWGLHQSTTASTYFLYRIRKGSATTSGTIYKDQVRIPTLPVASTNGAVSATFFLENTTGADITTALTLTGSVAAGTGIFAASAGNVASVTVEDQGLASQWPGDPIT